MTFLVVLLIVVGGVYGGMNGLGTTDTQPIHAEEFDQMAE
tara:strand:- start:592 stop:711 length:120 start_codon:yes stop_codon:yes gene_type:complete